VRLSLASRARDDRELPLSVAGPERGLPHAAQGGGGGRRGDLPSREGQGGRPFEARERGELVESPAEPGRRRLRAEGEQLLREARGSRRRVGIEVR
jgi:hypothetical protein